MMLGSLCIVAFILLDGSHVAFATPTGQKAANAKAPPYFARPLTSGLGHRPRGPPRTAPPRATAHLHDKHEHQHGVSCGHSRVIEKQEVSVRDFRTFLASRRGETAKPSRRGLGPSPGPSTIRITTEFQLASSALPVSQQQAVQAVMGTAIGVIKKFVQVIVTHA